MEILLCLGHENPYAIQAHYHQASLHQQALGKPTSPCSLLESIPEILADGKLQFILKCRNKTRPQVGGGESFHQTAMAYPQHTFASLRTNSEHKGILTPSYSLHGRMSVQIQGSSTCPEPASDKWFEIRIQLRFRILLVLLVLEFLSALDVLCIFPIKFSVHKTCNSREQLLSSGLKSRVS